MSRGASCRGRRGFALALVVLLLFAIGVAAAAGYLLVMSEFSLAGFARDGQQARTVARGGLQRFLGEHIGALADSAVYAIGGGVATVTASRLVAPDSANHLYYLRSEGRVTDPRTPQLPARRVVGTYAWHRREPVPHLGALVITGGALSIENGAAVTGLDASDASMCLGGGSAGTAGVATAGSVTTLSGGSYTGNPPSTQYASGQDVYDAVGLRWEILTNPGFPVQFDGVPPDFGALPTDSFPLVRYDGDLTADAFWSGRGALIVTGTFRPASGFQWRGIILAGRLGDVPDAAFPVIEGALVAGLGGPNPTVRIGSGTFAYHHCNVRRANRALGYLEVLRNTEFEVS